METIEVKMQVPKESAEIIDVVANIVKDYMLGKSLVLILTQNGPALVQALAGIQEVPKELISENQSEILAYLVDKMGDSIGR